MTVFQYCFSDTDFGIKLVSMIFNPKSAGARKSPRSRPVANLPGTGFQTGTQGG